MNVLGIIIIVVLCLVLVIALFFEIKGLIKSIKQYKSKKSSLNKREAKTDEDKSIK